MRLFRSHLVFSGALALIVSMAGCGSEQGDAGTPGAVGTTGTATGAGGTGGVGGGFGTAGAVATATGVTGTGGSAVVGAGGTAGAGGTPVGAGGTAGTAGSGGSTGTGGGVGGSGGGGGDVDPHPPLDCGPNGVVIEDAGPIGNRVNYVIVGDGYSASEVDTTYIEHINVYMAKRFSEPIGQPYLRYRKFVNICAIKVVSEGDICGSSALGCCGSDSSRLANCNSNAARQAIDSGVPDGFEVNWTAVVLNGSSWWNTGSSLMLWSGGNQDADGAALHEGGHGFHQLTDEYGACGTNLVNGASSSQDAENKWGIWMGFDQQPGTGEQGEFQCEGSNNLRPSDNSMMNSLFGENPDTSFNSVSREKMVTDFWRFVEPIDSTVPPEGAVASPTTLRVNVVDPAVLNVDWSVDGMVVLPNGGTTFDVAAAGLMPGSHTIEARAYDNAGEDLVRYRSGGDYGRMNWARSEQTATWTVTVP
jgi:hypothetical protein